MIRTMTPIPWANEGASSLSFFRLFVFAMVWVPNAVMAAPAEERPNFIFLLSDDQGYGDLERHGHPFLKTPNMNRIHDRAVRMTDFSVSPTCAPTRASLMTGMQEFNSGVTHTLMPRRLMNPAVVTLPQLLQQLGYATGMFGKWHLGNDDGYRPYQRGFDVSLTVPGDQQRSHYDPTLSLNGKSIETKGYRTDIFFDAAMEWIDEQREEPFFCYLPTYNAHSPLVVPDRYSKSYLAHTDEKTANYYGMLANLDENVGRLLNHLEARGLTENTILIFINDNGGTFGVDTFNAGMRGCKGTVWRGGTRAFCFWYAPSRWQARDEEALAGHIDILPTVYELAGGGGPKPPLPDIEGISLVDRLRDKDAFFPDRMLFQHVSRWHDGTADLHKTVNASVRWEKWHLLNMGTVEACLTGECRVYRRALTNEPLLYTKHGAVHYKLSESDQWELYDLENDPGESRNLAAAHPEVVSHMAEQYDDWWHKVRPRLINEVN